MITPVDERFRREVAQYDLRCTCSWCGAFDAEREQCVYGFPTEPHRHLPIAQTTEFTFCKAFELE